jgi:hypothetical protein
VDAGEGRRIESGGERTQGLADHVARAAQVEDRAVVVGILAFSPDLRIAQRDPRPSTADPASLEAIDVGRRNLNFPGLIAYPALTATQLSRPATGSSGTCVRYRRL